MFAKGKGESDAFMNKRVSSVSLVLIFLTILLVSTFVGTLNVVKADVPQQSSVSVSCSPSQSTLGSSFTCTATVSGSNPTGSISWSTSNRFTGVFGSIHTTLISGSASVTYYDTAPGLATITALYSGDAANEPSIGRSSLMIYNSLSDDFTADSGLNTLLWHVGATGDWLSPEGPAAPESPNLSFSSSGMGMNIGTGKIAGIQSVNSFSGPFTLQASVTATASYGDPFALWISTADGNHGVGIDGELGDNGQPVGVDGYYAEPLSNGQYLVNRGLLGIWLGADSGSNWWTVQNNLMLSAPQLNTVYQLSISVDSSGTASLEVSSGGKILGLASAQVGTGPFYISLMTEEDLPGMPDTSVGSDQAYWQNVSLQTTTPASPSASPTSVSFSSNPVSVGAPEICTAKVSGTNPTGSITWSSSSSTGWFSFASTSLSSGTASTVYTDTNTGIVTITATYSGDGTHLSSSGSNILGISNGLFDNFTTDSSLNPFLWEVNGPVGLKVADAWQSQDGGNPVTVVDPTLSFSSSNGMSVSGVSNYYQISTIQSVQSFSGPFTLQASAKAAASHDNPFALWICTADGNHGVGIDGNLGVHNGWYGIWESRDTGKGWSVENSTLYSSPQPDTIYQLSISVDGSGTASLTVRSGGQVLGSASVQVGTGPFYIQLIQARRLPNHICRVESGVLAKRVSSDGNFTPHFNSD